MLNNKDRLHIICVIAAIIIIISTFTGVLLGRSTLTSKPSKSIVVMRYVIVIKPNIKINYLIDPPSSDEPKLTIEEEIAEEKRLGEMDMVAQLVMAEAGDQDLMGKRYVVDVVLNRVDSNEFPDTIEDVIFQDNQFTVIKNGAFDRAALEISDECYEAVALEYAERSNYDVLYFSMGKAEYMSNGSFKHQDHWFGW